MAARPHSEVMLQAVVDAEAVHDTKQAAAQSLGMRCNTYKSALTDALGQGYKPRIVPQAEDLPPEDIDTGEIIDFMARRFAVRHAHAKAQRWRNFRVPFEGPYALWFFGDPHVDDNGCNWALLKEHCDLAASTEGVFAVNIGDSSNNWAGRLMRLWADQDTSSETARELVKWLLVDSKVPWWLWLHGNHDAWDGPVSKTIIEGFNAHRVPMLNWEAKVSLTPPKGEPLRLWASHNFKGHSQWNKLHGLQKAAQMRDWAHLYVAGHHHNFALHQEEHEERGFLYWLLRCRGYKFMDEHAMLHGFAEGECGASVVAVIDPSKEMGKGVNCFPDPHEAVDFLAFKRRKA